MVQREQRQHGAGISDADMDVAMWKSASSHQDVRIRTNKLHVTATELGESRSLTIFSVVWSTAGLYNYLGKQLGVIWKRRAHPEIPQLGTTPEKLSHMYPRRHVSECSGKHPTKAEKEVT